MQGQTRKGEGEESNANKKGKGKQGKGNIRKRKGKLEIKANQEDMQRNETKHKQKGQRRKGQRNGHTMQTDFDSPRNFGSDFPRSMTMDYVDNKFQSSPNTRSKSWAQTPEAEERETNR